MVLKNIFFFNCRTFPGYGSKRPLNESETENTGRYLAVFKSAGGVGVIQYGTGTEIKKYLWEIWVYLVPRFFLTENAVIFFHWRLKYVFYLVGNLNNLYKKPLKNSIQFSAQYGVLLFSPAFYFQIRFTVVHPADGIAAAAAEVLRQTEKMLQKSAESSDLRHTWHPTHSSSSLTKQGRFQLVIKLGHNSQ